MFTAADLIHAVLRRLQLVAPHLRRPPGEFPPGWKQWFDAMPVREGAVTGATARSLIAVLVQRPLAERPARSPDLTRWQAFNTLWRQEWTAPEPEDRRLRLFAGSVTAVWHVLFGLLVLWFWVGQVRYMEEASKRRGEAVVQIEFIGRGTPEEIGGGQPPAPADIEAPAPVARPAAGQQRPPPPVAAAPAEMPEVPETDAGVPEPPGRDAPQPQPPAPAPQDVAVSAPAPDAGDFVLMPPTPRIELPPPRAPGLDAADAPLQAMEVPEPVRPLRSEVAARPTPAPALQSRIPEVAQREVAAPVSRPELPGIAVPGSPQPVLRAPEAQVRQREVPAPTQSPPAATPAAPAPAGAAPEQAPTRPASTARAGTSAPARAPASSPSTVAGEGPRPVAAEGGFPAPARSDDWGASQRDLAGGQRGEPLGLYNAEGGPRLAERPVNTGQPPGTLDDRIVDLDRSGTWLKRKPNDYEPTAYDQYWRPGETLLAEWVRKGVKRVAIPIPGTTKSIDCVVSLLALGGACGISDPNLNDQPAVARPPPDIPFKPHLQEGGGADPDGDR